MSGWRLLAGLGTISCPLPPSRIRDSQVNSYLECSVQHRPSYRKIALPKVSRRVIAPVWSEADNNLVGNL